MGLLPNADNVSLFFIIQVSTSTQNLEILAVLHSVVCATLVAIFNKTVGL